MREVELVYEVRVRTFDEDTPTTYDAIGRVLARHLYNTFGAGRASVVREDGRVLDFDPSQDRGPIQTAPARWVRQKEGTAG